MLSLDKTFCIGCGLNRAHSSMHMIMGEIGFCKECSEQISTTKDMTFSGKEFTDIVISPFLYDGVISDSVREFKFAGQKKYGDFLAAIALEYLKNKDLLSGYDLIIPVPLHKNRLAERGYNQAEIIANRVGKSLSIKVDTESLIRVKDTKHQSLLNAYERIENVKDAFRVVSDEIAGKNIILVDDIYTMGETANECAKALKAAGAGKVLVFTICKRIKSSLF